MSPRISLRLRATLLASCVLAAAVCASASVAGQGGVDYVILVDCTGTMQHAGRGAATMDALQSFMGSVNEGSSVTVYGYGEKPFAAMADYPVIVGSPGMRETIVERLNLPFTANRTDITRGLELVWRERKKVFSRALSGGSAAESGSAYVILLTDGKLIPVYDDYAEYDGIYQESKTRLRQLGSLFADAGIPIYSVGLGRAERVDGELLTQVSESSGGIYRHASSSDRLPAVFESLCEDVIASPTAVVETGGEEALMVWEGASVSEESAGRGVLDGIVESASAADTRRTGRVVAALSLSSGDLRSQVYQAIIGVLGAFMGLVALGVHKRQPWTSLFVKPFLEKEIRIKGYLRRILPEGVIAALSNIPIENPGLPTLEIGAGTDYAPELRKTLIEFAGTTDGSPPVLRVLMGSVMVSDEIVQDTRVLVDGDIIECEGKAYEYLRGRRR